MVLIVTVYDSAHMAIITVLVQVLKLLYVLKSPVNVLWLCQIVVSVFRYFGGFYLKS